MYPAQAERVLFSLGIYSVTYYYKFTAFLPKQ